MMLLRLPVSVFRFLADIYHAKGLLLKFAANDYKARYLGSYLGLFWAFAQPAITILIFWFVFQIGFKVVPTKDVPFILWLICGMVPWFFFVDAFGTATTSISEYSFLVKKVVFRVSLLPVIKLLAACITHLFLICVIVIFFIAYKFPLDLHMLQAIYYSFAMFFLLLGLSWLTSALNVFVRDTGQFVAMCLQFGFWITPIFWSIDILPQKYHFFIKLNPVFYITEGYRDSFINKVWFWEHWKLSIYFWLVALFIFFLGAIVFKKLKPHFADVL